MYFCRLLAKSLRCDRGWMRLPAERFELASDTVYWTVLIPSGTECLQGLRGKTQLLNEVKLVDAPSAGVATIAGPSFRYQAYSSPGTDRFRIAVSGENRGSADHGSSLWK
jgi:hypothetical protein